MDEFFDVLDENGNFTGEIVSREDCHKKGLWHKAVVVFVVSPDNKKVLLQQRSAKKKLWPNLWDVTSGGHVLSGEFGCEAGVREAREEIGIDVDKDALEFIGATRSENIKGDIVNRHFNEYYLIYADVDADDLKLQEEEVQDAKWFSKEEIADRVSRSDYSELTDKVGAWKYLLTYLELNSEK